MASETLGEVLRRIGRRAGLDGVLALTDAQLLERFAAGRDEPAFAALMVRHGPMVLGVCRRMLHDAGRAEDAFQAAFLVPARKAGAVRRRALLGAWLYGVAFKVSARLRGREWKRQAREKPTDFADIPAADEPDSSDYPAVHEKVQRLPERYRDPVVLCYLEGRTHEEAARLLRWPLGTVKGRLARARDLLRSRLMRRGVGPCEGPWPNALAGPAAPAALVDATVRAAPLFAAGDPTAGGLASARALALSQGALRTMMLTNAKIAATLMLVAALALGTGGYLYRTTAAEPGPAPKAAANADKPAPPAKPNADKDAIQGTWQVTGAEMGGKEAPDNEETKRIKSTKWVISPDKITLTAPGQAEHNVRFKLDPTKKPKEIDVTPLDGPENEKGKLTPAIYSLEGDVLKICLAAPTDGPRPTELATKEGGSTMLLTLRREDKPADKPKDDKAAIQGTWQIADFEVKGKGPDAETLKKIKGAKWVFTGDTAVVQTPGEKDEPATFRLDPSKTPKETDFTPPDGGAARDRPAGIYRLEDDTLTMCFAGPEGGPRPTEFAAKEGGKTVLLTLKRDKAGTEKAKDDKEALQGTWDVIGVLAGGKEAPDDDKTKQLKSARWTFTGDKVTIHGLEAKDETATFTLDPTKTPREIDLTPPGTSGVKPGTIMPGIYSMDGNLLKICIPMPAPPQATNPVRPTELATKEDGATMLLTLQRQAK